MSKSQLKCGSSGESLELTPLLFINGEWVASGSGETFPTIDPATEAEICQVPSANAEDVDRAVAAAKEAFYGPWRATPTRERGMLLCKLAEAMRQNQKRLAQSITLDNGKPFTASMSEVKSSIDMIQYYAGWADKVTGKVLDNDPHHFTYTRHEPYGVVGGIVPWNYPLLMLAQKAGPALACGNTVVLKTSEYTPLNGFLFAELCNEAGFPKGVVNVLSGWGPSAGAPISQHKDVRKISFTGSVGTGRKIMEAASSSNMKKVTLELGGKGPCIVFDDADLDNAALWTAVGIYANSGQVCCAGTRLFVQSGIYDQFMEKFRKNFNSPKVGDPWAKDTGMGPIVSKQQFERVMGYIGKGKEGGAAVEGGERVGECGFYVQPTIFTGVTDDMAVAREEIFGPVGCVFKFESEEEVVQRANDTDYGLSAAVFSKDVGRCHRVAHQMEAGTVWVNVYYHLPPNTMFGGYKQSGQGRELGEYGLEEYTQVKCVHLGGI